MRLQGLPPLARPDARVLVLGSLPGGRSLAEGRYYVGQGNRFWRMMDVLLHVDHALPYEARCRALAARGVALWDVIGSCERDGSLDSRIVRDSEVPNDLDAFLGSHPAVRSIALNGGKASKVFARTATATIAANLSIDVLTLPSTSGANTRVTTDELVERWRVIVDSL